MEEKWVLQAKKGDFYGLAEEFGLDPVTVRLMVNRGIVTSEEIRRYLYGTADDEYDASLMKGAARAAELLWEAVRRHDKIFIASDFDVDGIFSGEILWEGIRFAGGSCHVKAPNRVKEGYGVNEEMVREAYAEGYTVMITCDNGIAAFDACKTAKNLGMTVIVTDHHQCIRKDEGDGEQVVLPEADVIVNPHQPGCAYPFPEICGAAVAYKVMELFFRQGGLSEERCRRFLEYVSIATVADVMELRDENRIFVREGLRRLVTTENHGLRALMRRKGLDPERLTSYSIGFVIGPCFNSTGRLDTVDRAFRLLQAGLQEAEVLAEELKELNDQRKLMTVEGTEAACARIEELPSLPDVLVIPVPECHESIVGIVAGRVRERYHHPVFVLTRTENGWKGSGRSIEAFDMFEHLLPCQDLLTKFGGHPMAAGLSLPEENLAAFTERINGNTGLTPQDFVPIIKIDMAMPIDYIHEKLLEEIHMLEPFGKGNLQPLFAESRFLIRSARVVGKNRNVLQLQVENSRGARMGAIYFGDIPAFDALVREKYGEQARKNMYRGYDSHVELGLTYVPSINEYNGTRRFQIEIKNIR